MSLILHIQFFMKCYWFYLSDISCIGSFSISTASVTLIMPQNYCNSYLLFYIPNFFLFSNVVPGIFLQKRIEFSFSSVYNLC